MEPPAVPPKGGGVVRAYKSYRAYRTYRPSEKAFEGLGVGAFCSGDGSAAVLQDCESSLRHCSMMAVSSSAVSARSIAMRVCLKSGMPLKMGVEAR